MKKKKATTRGGARKTRYVRVKLEYVIDVGREVKALPFEILSLAAKGGATKFVVCGLVGTIPPKHQARLSLIGNVHRSLALYFPKKRTRRSA